MLKRASCFIAHLALVLLLFLYLASVCLANQAEVHYIDVGHGDSIYISLPDQVDILIDGGGESYGNKVVNYLQNQSVDEIDLLIATHPHDDHIGGLDTVLQAFTVLSVLDNGKSENTQSYRDYIAAVQAEGCTYEIAAGQLWNFGPYTLTVLGPLRNYSNVNNNSIVLMLQCEDVKFLFTGDIELEAENELVNLEIAADILKVAHHGCITSTSAGFLSAVSPKLAVISVSNDLLFQTQLPEVLKKLSAANVRVFRTDLDGSIVITTDGSTYNVRTEKGGNQVIKPFVMTGSPTNITFNSVTLNGAINDTGGQNCDRLMFKYRTEGTTTWNITNEQTGSFEAGSFSLNLTGLVPNTTYEYVSMAHNSEGWSEGPVFTFKTAALPENGVCIELSANTAPTGANITATATAFGITNPQYEFWVKNPKDDTWSSRPFSSSNKYSFTQTVPGTYTIYTYCKGADAPYSSTVSAAPANVIFTKDNAVCTLTVDGPNGSQPLGGSATFTATATDQGGTPMYQFWVHDTGGWRVAQDYSTTDTFTMDNLQCGSYTIAAYALDSGDITSGNWGATYVKAFVLNVNSSVSLNAPANVPAGSAVNLTAQAGCLAGVEYQFWYQTPDGAWYSSGGYTTSNSYNFTAGTTGTYKVIVYAKDHYAPDTDQFSVWDIKTINCP